MAQNVNIAEAARRSNNAAQAGPSCNWTWWLLDAICDVVVGAALCATIDMQQVKHQRIELYYCSNAIP